MNQGEPRLGPSPNNVAALPPAALGISIRPSATAELPSLRHVPGVFAEVGRGLSPAASSPGTTETRIAVRTLVTATVPARWPRWKLGT